MDTGGNDEFGIGHQRPGDSHPLPLTAGELVGIAVGVQGHRRQLHQLQRLVHPLVDLRGGFAQVQRFEGLRHDLPNGKFRVQGVVGILENHLDLFSVVQDISAPLDRGNVDSVDVGLAGGDVLDLEKHLAQGGFAAAGLAHQPDDFALLHLEAYLVHGAHHAGLAGYLLEKAGFQHILFGKVI